MRRQVCLGAMIVVMVFLTLSCGRTYSSYVPATEFPRMVYLGREEILNLRTVAARLYDRNVFVEVTTLDGATTTGKLLRIDESELMMSPSYFYDMAEDLAGNVDVEKVIRKDQIIILKVF